MGRTCLNNVKKHPLQGAFFPIWCARRETRTLKGLLPTASETATFTNFAIRAGSPNADLMIGDANIC